MSEEALKVYITNEIHKTQKNKIFRILPVTMKSAKVIIYNNYDTSI